MYTYAYEPFDRVFEVFLDNVVVREFYNGAEARDYCCNMNACDTSWRNRV